LVSTNFADFVESDCVHKSPCQFDVPSVNEEEGIKNRSKVGLFQNKINMLFIPKYILL